MICSFFSIKIAVAALLVGLVLATPAAAQDWRTSGEDPCACTDSMPYIIGPRPPVAAPEQAAAVIRDSGDPSCRVARLAVEALRNAHTDLRATDALVARLQSPACAIRASAAWSLVRHRSPAIGPALLPLLADPDRRVRQAAAYALGYHGDRAAVAPLIALLNEENKNVKQAAATALGRLGDPAARPALARLLDDREKHVREAAADALKELGRR